MTFRVAFRVNFIVTVVLLCLVLVSTLHCETTSSNAI